MRYDPKKHNRHSIRIAGYDYGRAGYYFVTFGTHQRRRWLATIDGCEHRLTAAGAIVAGVWQSLAQHNSWITLDAFIIMPDHVHGIVQIHPHAHDPQSERGSPARSLASLVQNFKSISSRRVHQAAPAIQRPLWHRNYYEHIIRADADLGRIRHYIAMNPARWQQ